jgi:DNA topoisomerase-1
MTVNMDLVIVESPTKARTLGRFLPDKDYSVVATVGHVRDLPKSQLGVDVEHDFKPEWVMVKGKQKMMRELRAEGLKAKRLLLATDPDREGEAIAWHVKELLREDRKFSLGKKQVKRISFHEITKQAILKAIEESGKLNEDLFDAQQARRVVDRLVGYKLSPVLWRKIRRGLSAGRVQSVAVRLVVEKEREREAFKAEEYWEIVTELSSFKVSKFQSLKEKKAINLETSKPRNLEIFFAWLKTREGKKLEVDNEKQAMEVMGDLDIAEYVVKGVEKKEMKRQSPPPFTTSTLQQNAGQKLEWSAKRTMRVAQKLYEQGLITYHRTDSLHVAETAIRSVRDFIKQEYGEKYLFDTVRRFKTKAKVAQEAHEAIRPTKVGRIASTKSQIPNPKQIPNSKSKYSNKKRVGNKDQDRLYGMIWKRFVACQMAAAVFDRTRIEVDARVGAGLVPAQGRATTRVARTYGLITEGKVRKFDGWLKVYGRNTRDDELPLVKEREALQLIEVTGGQLFT